MICLVNCLKLTLCLLLSLFSAYAYSDTITVAAYSPPNNPYFFAASENKRDRQ